jgi:hypothetical protein
LIEGVAGKKWLEKFGPFDDIPLLCGDDFFAEMYPFYKELALVSFDLLQLYEVFRMLNQYCEDKGRRYC